MYFKKKQIESFSWVEALPDATFVFSADGRHCAHNRAAAAFLETVYCPALPEDLKGYKAWLEKMEAPGAPMEIMAANIPYRCETRHYEGGAMIMLRPLKGQDHILRLSAALDNMPWGILTVDLDGKEPVIVYANKPAGRYIGAESSAILHQRAQDVFRVFGVQEEFGATLTRSAPHYADLERVRDGGIEWFRLHCIPYRQNRRYCLVVIEDTSEEKRKENHYLQAQRLEALGQLAGGVAHDFNNILSIIDGYARIGKKSTSEAQETYDCLEHISQAVQRAASITSQLLTFGGHEKVEGEINDLGEIVSAQEALLRPVLDASINLMMKIETGLFICAPQDPVCQILLNLCINSRDAMPDGGDLIVETGRKGDNVFLRVIDSGTGMPPEVRAKMFNPFFTTKERGKGTGLGLSMVYSLVKDMNGEIDVVTQQGAGTSITVWLPYCARGPYIENDNTDVEHMDAGMTLTGYSALVVEDEPDLLKILKSMLSDMGLVVLAVSNGNEALAMQEEFKGTIDFLITDVVMPDMNGVKLSALFRAVRPETKVVFMSGYPAGEHMARVKIPRNAILLPKPVQAENLTHLLCSLAQQAGHKGVEGRGVQVGQRGHQ